MTRNPRFWPLAVLILLPVLMLAGVAAYGLKQRRLAMREEAFQLCRARKCARDWIAALEAAAEASPPVVLYDEVPQPRLALPGDAALEATLKSGDAPALELLMYTPAGAGLTAAGLPVRAVAAWRWLEAKSALDEEFTSVNRTGISQHEQGRKRAEAVVHLVTVRAPSALSSTLIERLAESFPDAAAQWRREWRLSEVRRAVLRGVAPVYRPGRFTHPQAVFIPITDPIVTGLSREVTARGPLSDMAMGLVEGPGSVALHYPKGGAANERVLLEYELRQAFRVMQEKTRDLLPPWAAVNVMVRPASLAGMGIPLQLAGLGDDIAEVLSTENQSFSIIETGPQEKGWLLRDYYRLVWWAAAVIGSAFLTAALGLWLVRRTLEKERRLGELKSQFVSSVSHELRAPVGSLRLMADGLASGKVTGAAADEFHRLMAGEGARLSSLIENVLDFARIEQGRKNYHMAETDLPALVQDAVKLMTPQAEARGLRMVFEMDRAALIPRVDAGALQQALINLLDNAVKFSPQDAEVRVTLRADPSRNTWSLTVTDHGPGIPKEEQVRIFERFYRLGNELRRETTGTGIGLAIVKHIVEGHGGRVLLESAPGEGSAFRMEFPIEPSDRFDPSAP